MPPFFLISIDTASSKFCLQAFILYSDIFLIVALQFNLRLGRFFHFFNLIHSREGSLDWGSALRNAAT
jgi:hypothetical protein